MPKNNYKKVIQSLYSKRFRNDNLSDNLFFNDDAESKIALSVLDPLFDEKESKDALFSSVKTAFHALGELMDNPDNAEISASEVIEKANEISTEIDKYFEKNAEYSDSKEYRAILRLKSEISTFSSEIGIVADLEKNDNEESKDQKDAPVTVYDEYDKDLTVFQKYGQDAIYSEEKRESEKNKTLDSIDYAYGVLGNNQGKIHSINAVKKHYDKEAVYYNLVSPIYKDVNKAIPYNYIMSETLANGLKEFENQYSRLQSQHETFQRQLADYKNALQEKNQNEKKLKKSLEKKDKKGTLSASGKDVLFNAQHADLESFETIVKHIEDQYNEALDYRNGVVKKTSDNCKEYLDSQLISFKKTDISSYITHDLEEIRMSKESPMDLSQDNISKKNDVTNALTVYKDKLENYAGFLHHYHDTVKKHREVEKDIKEQLALLEDPALIAEKNKIRDEAIKARTNPVKVESFSSQILNLQGRLEKVKSRTFWSNSTEFQNMFDKVNDIAQKLNDENQPNYKNSDDFLKDMATLNEYAVTYSKAKGGAVRSTTQGQERLDIAHEIISNYAKNNELDANMKNIVYGDNKEKIDKLNDRLQKETKAFEQFCEKSNDRLMGESDKAPCDEETLQNLIQKTEKEIDNVSNQIKDHEKRIDELLGNDIKISKDDKEAFENKEEALFINSKNLDLSDRKHNYDKSFYNAYTRYTNAYHDDLEESHKWDEECHAKDANFVTLCKKLDVNSSVKKINFESEDIKALQKDLASNMIKEIKDFQDKLGEEIYVKLYGDLAKEKMNSKERVSAKEIEGGLNVAHKPSPSNTKEIHISKTAEASLGTTPNKK